MTSNYWLYLEPFVYMNIQKNQLLIYNTLNGKTIQETNQDVIELMRKMSPDGELYVTELPGQDLQNGPMANFIKQLRHHFMGDIIDQSHVSGKPVQVPPQAKIMETTGAGKADLNRNNLTENLSHLNIYLNNSKTGKSNFPEQAFRQFLAPAFAGDDSQELPLEPLLQFLAMTKTSPLEKINLLGGNIFTYPHLPRLIDALNKRKALKAYYAHYTQVAKCHLDELAIEGELHIMVNFPKREEDLADCMEALKSTPISIHFHFLVASRDDLEQADREISRFNIADYDYMPYYDGCNLDFFKEAVFIDREDILEEQPSIRKILMRSKVNPLHFGNLTIMSNGYIHANINEPEIGVISVNALHESLYTAIHQDLSWSRTRRKVTPCKECIFQDLCPPLSNYELVMERNNLCHIIE